MHWKEQLKNLEQNKQWDSAIELMQEVIEKNPNDLDAYLSINYLIMNLLVEEKHDCSKHDFYSATLKHYFDESYAKFSENPEYLFYIGTIAFMSVWYFGIEYEDAQVMSDKAIKLDPDNILYQWNIYYRVNLDKNNIHDTQQVMAYVNQIIKDHSVKKTLESKGALGEYIWSMMEHWAKRMIKEYESN